LPIHFVAAFAPELAALTGDARRDIVGVGLVEAAIGASRVLANHPSAIVLVGTVGAYANKGLAIGDVVVASRVLLTAPSGAFALAMSTEILTDDSLTAGVSARQVTVATTLSITTDDVIASQLGEAADVEHLEAFAVARACALAHVPFTAVFGVANEVGSRGREQWKAHHVSAAAAACKLAARLT
jgi:futalosine hydrolase